MIFFHFEKIDICEIIHMLNGADLEMKYEAGKLRKDPNLAYFDGLLLAT